VFKSLVASYKRTAEDTIERYHADAAINGLEFDRDQEEKAVETFTSAVTLAGDNFLKDPLGAPLIPNWNRVTAAIPGFLSSLAEAVDEDNKS
jgi:glucosyl-3-phosphoglycerate synthase